MASLLDQLAGDESEDGGGDDPLAGYKKGWRKPAAPDAQTGDVDLRDPTTRSSAQAGPDDPLAGYSPDWKKKFLAPAGPHAKEVEAIFPNASRPNSGARDVTTTPATAVRTEPHHRDAVLGPLAQMLAAPVENPAGFIAQTAMAIPSAIKVAASPSKAGPGELMRPGTDEPQETGNLAPVTGKEKAFAAAQLASTLLAPEVSGGVKTALEPAIGAGPASLAGGVAAGALPGAAFAPEHPILGGVIGGTLGGLHAAAGYEIPRPTAPLDPAESLANIPDRLLSNRAKVQPRATVKLGGPEPGMPTQADVTVEQNTVEQALKSVAAKPKQSPLDVIDTAVDAANKVADEATGKPTAPTETPSVAPDAKAPEWLRANMRNYLNDANTLGIADDVEALSAQRLTAHQIRAKLADRMGGLDPTDRLNVIRAVRSDRGIPSMDEEPAFEAWIAKRAPASAPEPEPAPERVTNAVTQYDGKYYDAPTHAQTFEMIRGQIAGKVDMDRVRDDFFRTSTGRIVTREQAYDIAENAQQGRERTRGGRGRSKQLFAEALPEIRAQLPRVAPESPSASAPQTAPNTAPAVRDVPVGDIDVEPHRFQFKLNTNERGVGRELESVKKFNPNLAGVIQVWRDPADGRLKLVNGHHRHDLATRSGAPTITAREIEASGAPAARTIGALTNIAEGRGTPVDAAKLFRDSGMTTEDLEREGISLTGATARDGLALAKLHPTLFDDVVAGRLPVARGAVIGASGLAPEEQLGLTKMLDAREAKGKRLTNDEMSELIRFVKGAGTETVNQETLFGDETMSHSLAIEKAQLSAYVLDRLRKDKRLFGFLTKGGRADKIEGAGVGSIKVDRAGQLATEAGQAEEVYTKLSGMSGPVSDALANAARQLAKGGDANATRSELYKNVADAVAATLGNRAGGSSARGAAAVDGHEPTAVGSAGAPDGEPAFNDPDQVGFLSDPLQDYTPDWRNRSGDSVSSNENTSSLEESRASYATRDFLTDWRHTLTALVKDKSVEAARAHYREMFDGAFTVWQRMHDDGTKALGGEELLQAFHGAAKGAAEAMNLLTAKSRGGGRSALWSTRLITPKDIEAVAMGDSEWLASQAADRVKGSGPKAYIKATRWLEDLQRTLDFYQSPSPYSASPFHAEAQRTIGLAGNHLAREMLGEDEHGILPNDDRELDSEMNRRMLPRSTRAGLGEDPLTGYTLDWRNRATVGGEGQSLMEPGAGGRRESTEQLSLFRRIQDDPTGPEANELAKSEANVAYGSEAKALRAARSMAPHIAKLNGIGIDDADTRASFVERMKDRARVSLVGKDVSDIGKLRAALSVIRHPLGESLNILFPKNGVVADHFIYESGSLSTVQFEDLRGVARAVAQRAKELGITKIDAAHNHPSGNPTPSKMDRAWNAAFDQMLMEESHKIEHTAWLERHTVVDHDAATVMQALSTTKGGGWLSEAGDLPITIPGADSQTWKTSVQRGQIAAKPDNIAALVRDGLSPDAVTVLYRDASGRFVAGEPRSPHEPIEDLLAHINEQRNTLAAHDVIIAAGSDRAGLIRASALRARLEGPPRAGRFINQSFRGHARGHYVTDVLTVTPNGPNDAPTISSSVSRGLYPSPDYDWLTDDLQRSSRNAVRVEPDDPASLQAGRGASDVRGDTEGPRQLGEDLFGNPDAHDQADQSDSSQESLFASGSERRTLADTERASRAELDRLKQERDLLEARRRSGRPETPAEQARNQKRRTQIASRIAELEKLVNRDKKISADEMSTRATAGDLFSLNEPTQAPDEDATKAFAAAEQDIDFDGAYAKEAAKSRGTWIDRLNRFTDAVANGLGPIERLGARVEDVVRPGKNPRDLLSYTKSSDHTVRSFLRDGVVDPITRQIIGPSFESIFAPFKRNEKRIRQAMVYIKAVRDIGRGPSSVNDDPELWRRAQLIADAGDKDHQLKTFADNWRTYVDGVGQYAVKSGLWTPELWRKLKDSDALYVRFRRILDENVNDAVGTGSSKGLASPRRMVNVGPGVDRFHGSRRPITNPAEAMAEYTGQIIRRADRYRVGAALFDATDALGSEGQFLLTRITSTEAKQRNILTKRARENAKDLFLDEAALEELTDAFDLRFDKDNPIVWRNKAAKGGAAGESSGKEYAQVNSPELWRAVAALNVADESALRAVLDVTLRPLRRMFVATTTGINPRFALGTNLVRDALDLGAKSQGGIGLRDIGRGYGGAFVDMWGGSEDATQASAAGLGNTSMYRRETHPRAFSRQVAPTTTLDRVRSTIASKNPLTLLLHGLEKVGDMSDRAPRLAEYLAVVRTNQHKVDSGEWTPEDLRLYAASRARPVTIDFANKPGNAVARLLADYIPFFGPAVQAPISMGQSAARNPKRVAAVAAGVALLAALAWAMKEKKKKEERMALNDRPSGERAAFIMFPLGNGSIVRVPVSAEMGVVAAGVMYTLDKMHDHDPNAGRMFRAALIRLLPPGLAELAEGNLTPPVPGIQQAIEIGRNKDSFTGRPIVPTRLQDVPPGERRFDTTSPTYDAVAAAARRLGIKDFSPLEAEHFAKGITGGATPLITMITDRLASPLMDRPIPERGDLPLAQHPLNPASAFYKPSATRSPVSEQDYYDLRERYDQSKTFLMRSDKAGDAKAVRRGIKEYGKNLDPRAGEVFSAADKELAEFKDDEATIQAARAGGEITPDKARQLRQKITKERQRVTHDAVVVLHAIGVTR